MLGLNQTEMGEALGCSKQAYHNKEVGKNAFSDKEKMIFKKMLIPLFPNITLEEIFLTNKLRKVNKKQPCQVRRKIRMTKLTELEERINDLIPLGRGNPITANELSKITRQDIRTVRTIIHRLIVIHHIAIGGSRMGNKGYYKPTNAVEVLEAIRPIQAQINNEQKRVNVLLNALREEQAT